MKNKKIKVENEKREEEKKEGQRHVKVKFRKNTGSCVISVFRIDIIRIMIK